jgi:hypothetical protein
MPNKIKYDCENPDVDIEDWCEDWEEDYQLFEKEDWKGLLKLRKIMAERNTDDIYAQWRYGEALILNKQYKAAIEFLTPIYKEEPDYLDVVHTILDALFESGKTENDFDWIKKPEIMRLDKTTLDHCENLLKGKRKGIPVYQIHADLSLPGAYLTFDEEELLDALSKDERFSITGDRNVIWDLMIKLSRR